MPIWLVTLLQNPSDFVFWISATIGTALFLLRILMTFIGDALSSDVDMDVEIHADEHHFMPSLKLFTLHSLSGFLMMFGWIGLACTHQYGLSYTHSLLIALVAGTCMLFITAFIMQQALSLEEHGAVFSTKKTVGLVGTVYQRIPAGGQGKIQLMVNNLTREVLAQSHNKKAIESFTLVKVVKAIDHEIVEVVTLEETP